jgi:CBS domain containing-hemolysin-like protein
MCPRIDVFALDTTKKILDVTNDLIAKGFSRVPVYEENLDKIIGVLYVKDLLPHLENDNFNWTSLLRKPLYIPENKKLDDLLTEFKTKKIHMGIVVDEYGGTSGIITLEDVIEEIFGEISGEFDEEDNLFSKLDDFTFIFDSKINLQDFYRAINLKDSTSFEEIALEIETLGGFLIEKVKKIPRVGQIIIHDSYKFIVEIVDKKRIKQVKLIIPKDK